MTITNCIPELEAQELVITRIFDAPRELVFRAWTDPALIALWWGPKYFTAPVCMVELHEGGRYLYCMRSPEGQNFWSTGIYTEIVEPERIVYSDSLADADGNIVPPAHYGMDGNWPLELLVTVTFEEHDGKTTLTPRQAGIPTGQLSD